MEEWVLWEKVFKRLKISCWPFAFGRWLRNRFKLKSQTSNLRAAIRNQIPEILQAQANCQKPKANSSSCENNAPNNIF
jgi:hypothetical protein